MLPECRALEVSNGLHVPPFSNQENQVFMLRLIVLISRFGFRCCEGHLATPPPKGTDAVPVCITRETREKALLALLFQINSSV